MATYEAILTLSVNDATKVIPHNLGNSAAKLVCCTPGGWPGRPYITARASNDCTVTFLNQVPAAGGPYTLDVRAVYP